MITFQKGTLSMAIMNCKAVSMTVIHAQMILNALNAMQLQTLGL
jgi:hypothetical protein